MPADDSDNGRALAVLDERVKQVQNTLTKLEAKIDIQAIAARNHQFAEAGEFARNHARDFTCPTEED